MQSSLEKDRRTLEAIGLIYCKAHHADAVKDAAGLCPSCREAVDHTLDRTVVCPYDHEETARIVTSIASVAKRSNASKRSCVIPLRGWRIAIH